MRNAFNRIAGAVRAVPLVVAALLTACTDASGPPVREALAPSGKAQFEIRDARNAGGSGFYFLTPIAANLVTYPGTFDGTRNPTVQICAWSGSACAGPVVASYSRIGGTGGVTIQVDVVNQLYRVDWPTIGLPTGQLYRIRVLESGAEYGFADAKVPGASESAATLTAQNIIPLGNSSRLTIRFRMEQGATPSTGFAFLSAPKLNPASTIVGIGVSSIASIGIVQVSTAVVQSVQLVSVDDSGNELAVATTLLDNGVLANGDEIKGDGVYSGKFTPPVGAAQTLHYIAKIQGTYQGVPTVARSAPSDFNVLVALSSTDITNMLAAQDAAVNALNNNADVKTFDAAIAVVSNLMTKSTLVDYITRVGDDLVEVHYKNGIVGGILLTTNTPDGTPLRGGGAAVRRPSSIGARTAAAGVRWSPRVGGTAAAPRTVVQPPSVVTRADSGRRSKPAIPVDKQTRGVNDGFRNAASLPSPAKEVKSNRVLIFDPVRTEFMPDDESDAIAALAKKSDVALQVTHLIEDKATVNSLRSLTDYGVIYFVTHGAGGSTFLTGETVTVFSALGNAFDLLTGRLEMWTHGVIRLDASGSKVTSSKKVYAVTDKFIASLSGTFPNSVVIAAYCEGMMAPQALANAFVETKGALSYLGYSKNVSSGFAVTTGVDFMQKFMVDLKTVGQSHTVVTDPYMGAQFLLHGDPDAHLAAGLINGDFEFGDLTAWTQAGDGRVITKLGPIGPTQKTYMGVISTGLGFTVNSGQISQAFTVPVGTTILSLRWNFISEEFKEYIGSAFQDYFRIIIQEEGKPPVTLQNLTIDGVAAMFPLTYVSPTIVFDQGDVWGTGWRQSTFNIAAYAGKKVTLTLAAGDVGDSIYDTAILLDEIKVSK